jgi:3-phytase
MRIRRNVTAASTILVMLGVTMVVWPTPAAAVVAYEPVPRVSWGTNGTSESVVLQGGVLYVGGTFSALVRGSSSLPRANVGAIDATSGDPVSTFTANTNGTVETLATDGTALFIGGTFTTVNGVSRRNLARVDLGTGAVDPAFNPSPNSDVFDLWVSGTRLYVAGDFTSIGGQSRSRVAAINLQTTGSVVAGFAPAVNRRVFSVATSPDGSVVYIGGRFTAIGPAPNDYLAALDAGNGSVRPIDFVGVEPPDPATQTSNILDIDASATQVVAAIGGQGFNAVGAWNAASGAMQWRHGTTTGDRLDGDVQNVVLEGGTVYFGFHGGYNGSTSLRMMAAAAGSGALDPDFRPVTNGVRGVNDIATNGNVLAAVGDFTTSGGVALRGVALFPAGSGGGTTTTSSTTSTTTTTTTTDPSTTTSSTTSSTTTSSTTTTSTTTTTTSTTAAPPPPPGGTVSVASAIQTPNRAPAGTNDADDAAIWVHPTNPSRNLILGTIKQGGLDVYRPDGTVVQTVGAGGGRFNNVDLVYSVTLGGLTRDLAIVTDRGTDRLHIYRVDGDATPPVVEVTASGVPLLFGTTTKISSRTAYGVAAWRTPSGAVEVFASQENTTNLGKFVLSAAANGTVTYQRTATLSLPNSFTLPNGSTWTPCFNPSQPTWQAHVEGMVVDPGTGTLWADQEIVGLWRISTSLTSPQLVHRLSRFGQTWTVNNGRCVINSNSTSYGDSYLPGDLEGIGLYRAGSGSGGYLFMSNQGSSTFTVFDRDGVAYRGSFRVVAAGAIDAVNQTDGVAVTNVSMGPGFTSGMVVTQDGQNTPEGGTNFKFTPWQSVASALGLVVNTGGDPRS